jgi:type IX secretion system PorP/SprF family membrane protein
MYRVYKQLSMIANLKQYFLIFFTLTTIKAVAQQEPQYTQYMYNTLTVNPGYTGSTGGIDAVLLHRSQWVGIDGAPRTQSFSIHSPALHERAGLGLSAINDRLGPADEIYVDANFSYTLPVGRESKLAFGLKAGANVLSIDWSRGRAYQENDALLATNINNKISPSLGAGLYYYTNNWYVGASIPNFLKSDHYEDIQETTVSSRLHYYIIGGYVFTFSDNLKFKPAVLGKIVSGAPVTVDVSANFLLYEKLTLGAAYRWDDAVSGLAGFQVTKNLFVGYAYDHTITGLTEYNDGSHEVIVRFQLNPKTARIKSPRFF